MEIDFNEYKLSSELRGHEDDVRFLISLSLSLSLLNIAKNFNYCQKKKKKKNQYFDFLIILADIDFSDSFKFQLL